MRDRFATWAARLLCAGLALWLGVLMAVHSRGALWGDTVAWLGQGGGLLVVMAALVGLALRRRLPLGRALMAPSSAAFAGGAFALALVSGLAAHWLLLHGVPDVPDEFGYLHQARGFADGWLAPPSPPFEEFHYVSWGIHDGGSWYAVFPPGYGVLLAGGVRAGVPGLVNPLLGAALALVLFELAKELLGGDRPVARLAVLFYLASWFRMVHAASFMAHPTAALCAGLVILGVLRGVLAERPRLAWAALAGVAAAVLVATRPLNAGLLAIGLVPPIGFALAARARRARTARALLHVAVAAAPLLLAYAAYNRALTGSPLLAPQQRYMQLKEARKDCFRLGFGPGVGECPLTQNTNFGTAGFRYDGARKNTARRLWSLQRDLFGLAPLAALPLLGLVGGALGAAACARRRALLAWLGLTTILGYGLFFYHGVAYGARFYYEIFPLAALLAAAALGDLAALPARLPPGRVRGWLGGARTAAAWALPVALVIALKTAYPAGLERRARTQDGRLLEVAASAGADAVVFVSSMDIPAALTRHPAALARNAPLVVADLGDAANAGFLRSPQARGRRPYRLSGASLSALDYPADAPVRHEGGAKYPLQIAHGGFGDRVSSRDAGVVLSADEALRFRPGVSEPVPPGGAWFALPVFVADPGPLTLHVELAARPGGPRVAFAVDGRALSDWLDAAAAAPVLRGFDLPADLAAGAHWLTVRVDGSGPCIIDYVELRRR